MDRYDPNEWTKRFVTDEPEFCINVLRDINETVAALISERNFPPAVAGLDRIINGLIVFQNAGADFLPHICFFSWVEGELIAFGLEGANPSIRRQNAIKCYEDARDFAKSQNTKDNLTPIIEDLKAGVPFDELREDYDPDFPDSCVEMLGDLQERLVI